MAVSSYLKFLSAIDDLVLVIKDKVGECHIISKELPEGFLMSGQNTENG